jgi:hypothetical protein
MLRTESGSMMDGVDFAAAARAGEGALEMTETKMPLVWLQNPRF